MRQELKQRLYRGLAIGLLAAVTVCTVTLLFWPRVFDAFEAKSLDIRHIYRLQSLWNERDGAQIDDIIIVDIDNRSLDKLGQFNQWPRSYHARLMDYATQGGALAVGFDILFLEPQRNEEEDRDLINATEDNANVHHAITFSMADPDAFLYPMQGPPGGFDDSRFLSADKTTYNHLIKMERFDGKLVDLYNAAAGVGFANFSPDNDSVIRSMPMFMEFAGKLYPSFSLSIVLGALGANPRDVEFTRHKLLIHPPGTQGKTALHVPIGDKARMLINYQGTFQTFRYISYYDVLMQRVPKEIFNGRIVLVGSSAAGLSDIRPVPFQDAFPGVEIHANMIYNILTQKFIIKPPIALTIFSLFFITGVISLLGFYFKPVQSIAITIVLLGFYAWLSVALFAKAGIWLEMVRPILAILLAYLFVFIYRFMHEERDKLKLKNMFKHYVTSSVVEEMLEKPELLKLGGDRRFATAMFADIENFTTLSETMQPEKMVSQLNEYLTAMTNIILKYEGYLDKYEGDAIMAIFGVPVEQPDHAKRASMAALEMQRELVNLRKRWKQLRKPVFHARIGINTGNMIAGNIGGTERFDYTVIGDSVNLASRLEGVNKTYSTSIIISENTQKLLGNEFLVRELDRIRVKGKSRSVCIYELLDLFDDQLPDNPPEYISAFHTGLELYRNRDWQGAIDAFDKVLRLKDDTPSRIFVDRCRYFKTHPEPEDWDGVFDITTK